MKGGDDEAFDKMMAEMEDSEESDDEEDLANFYGAQSKTGLSGTSAPPGSYASGLVSSKAWPEDDIKFGSAKSAEMGRDEHLAFEAMKLFLTRPCRKDDPLVLCYVKRDRSGLNRITPKYSLFMEPAGGLQEGQEGRFLVSAQRRKESRTSNYLVSMEQVPQRNSDKVVGKLRATWSGSEYIIYDHGLNPEKCQTPSVIRRELGVIKFEYDQIGPGRMKAYVPNTSPSGVAQLWRPQTEEETMSKALENNDLSRLMVLDTKRPQWDESHGGYVLNFNGRVSESSVKNFQMVCSESDADITLQFGRRDKNTFALDFQYPLSPLQAFCICLASLDGKLVDSKGFENIKKMGGEKEDAELPGAKQGSMSGGSGITSALPSKQYVMDKLKRMTMK